MARAHLLKVGLTLAMVASITLGTLAFLLLPRLHVSADSGGTGGMGKVSGSGAAATPAATLSTPLAPAAFSPMTLEGGVQVVVYEGDQYFADSSATTVLSGFTAPTGPLNAKTTYIVADGQCGSASPNGCFSTTPSAGSGDTLSFTGGASTFTNGPDAFKGSDGCPWGIPPGGGDTCLWDTRTFDVTPYVALGATTATATVTSGVDRTGNFDCLENEAQIFAVGPAGAFAQSGYVASGTGLRNQGSGSIQIAGMPLVATVTRALLYWNVLNPTDPGNGMKFDGHRVPGVSIGTAPDPCWGAGTSWAYRADVTDFVNGNGTYQLTGYPTGASNGLSPWSAGSPVPMMEGASLVVIFGPSYYTTQVRGDGAVSYWPLDEKTPGSPAQDVISGNNGTVSAQGVTLNRVGRGPHDASYAFDGSQGTISLPSAASLSPPSVSVEGWMRIDQPPPGNTSSYLFKNGDQGNNGYSVGVSGGQPQGTVCVSAITCVSVVASTFIDDGSWHQLVLTKDANTVSLYVDGQSAGSQPAAGAIYYPSSTTVSIGSWSAANTGYLNGGIDDVSVYNTALTAQQVATHFSSGGCPQAPTSDLASGPPPVPVESLPAVPLHTDGRYIRDKNGTRVKLAAVSWYGAESGDGVPSGLQCQPLSAIVAHIAHDGFNAVRLTWATDTWSGTGPGFRITDPAVPPIAVAANPQLRGLGAHEVFDAVINELDRQGIMVILDNHVSHSDWCCNRGDGNSLWWTDYDPQGSFPTTWKNADNNERKGLYETGRKAWETAWQNIIVRYAIPGGPYYQAAVVGAELRNEPRADTNLQLAAVWGGSGTPEWEDWPKAATQAGNRILGLNSNLLIVVDGVDFSTRLGGQNNDPDPFTSIDQTPDLGGGLRGVAGDPVVLSLPPKHTGGELVYSAHDYQFNPGPVESADDYKKDLGNWWGYLLGSQYGGPVPVWLSEFGTCHDQETTSDCTAPPSGATTTNDQGFWFQTMTSYLHDNDVDWAYWPLNGTSAHEALSQGDCSPQPSIDKDHPSCVDPATRGTPVEGTEPRFLGIAEDYGVLDSTWRSDASPLLTKALKGIHMP